MLLGRADCDLQEQSVTERLNQAIIPLLLSMSFSTPQFSQTSTATTLQRNNENFNLDGYRDLKYMPQKICQSSVVVVELFKERLKFCIRCLVMVVTAHPTIVAGYP